MEDFIMNKIDILKEWIRRETLDLEMNQRLLFKSEVLGEESDYWNGLMAENQFKILKFNERLEIEMKSEAV
jgi:hypothetical protein